jgi:TetR/AcrR family transcriptional regulator, fatty acid metabolism regulator protein
MEPDSTKTDLKKNDKYHTILEAAIKVFAEQGFFHSTISQIAKEAGVAGGTIYLYFKNKDDILLQFFEHKTKQVFSGFREEVEKAGSAIDKLKNLIRRHLTEFQNDKNMAVVFQAEARQTRHIEKQIKEITKMYLEMVGELIEQGQEEGSIRKDLYVSLVKRYILGAVDEVINTWVHAGGRYELASMADPLVDLYFLGIGSNGTDT